MSEYDVHVKRSEDNPSNEMKLEEAVDHLESGIYELEMEHVENASPRQLRRILSFFDREKDEDSYIKVRNVLHHKQVPRIEIAHYGERIWSYFYEKYVARVVISLVVMFTSGAVAAPQLQDSRRMFANGWYSVFMAAGIVLLAWKIFQSFRNSGLSPKNSWVKERLGHRTVTRDGRQIGFARSLVINVLKSWSFIMWAIFISIIAENFFSPSVFNTIKGLTGSFYQKEGGLLYLVGFLLLIFWAVDMIVLERKQRALHDMLTKTWVLAVAPDVTDDECRRFLDEELHD